MTFETYVNYFNESILALGKTSSIKSSRSRLKKCVEVFGKEELPLDPRRVQKFITQLSQKYPSQTVANVWGAFRAVLMRAKSEGLISSVPSPLLPKIERSEQPWFTVEQMRILSRYEPIYAFASETGARIGEILAIQIPDIDFENKTIHIRRNVYDGVISSPKTRAGTRLISASTWLCDILKKECEGREDGFIFQSLGGGPRNPDSETRKLQHACTVFDIPYAGWHGFRRGNCTLMAMTLGIAESLIEYRVGHSVRGVLSRYIHFFPGEDREISERISEVLR